MRCLALVLLILSLLPGAACTGEPPEFERPEQKLGYSVGYQVGGDFRRQGLEIEPELVVSGVMDALAGAETQMTAEEMRQTLVELRSRTATD